MSKKYDSFRKNNQLSCWVFDCEFDQLAKMSKKPDRIKLIRDRTGLYLSEATRLDSEFQIWLKRRN